MIFDKENVVIEVFTIQGGINNRMDGRGATSAESLGWLCSGLSYISIFYLQISDIVLLEAGVLAVRAYRAVQWHCAERANAPEVWN